MDRIDADAEAFKRERADQNEALGIATENDGRSDVGSDKDFRRGHRLGCHRPVGILDPASAERRNADLFQEYTRDLGDIGAGVHESFQLDGSSRIGWIGNSEFHVECPHVGSF